MPSSPTLTTFLFCAPMLLILFVCSVKVRLTSTRFSLHSSTLTFLSNPEITNKSDSMIGSMALIPYDSVIPFEFILCFSLTSVPSTSNFKHTKLVLSYIPIHRSNCSPLQLLLTQVTGAAMRFTQCMCLTSGIVYKSMTSSIRQAYLLLQILQRLSLALSF